MVPPLPGNIIWHELYTPDPEAARRFYGELFGWETITAEPGAGLSYTMFRNGEDELAGVMQAGGNALPPQWLPYVGVADTAATIEKARELGAEVLMEAREVAGVGVMGLIRDPGGAVIALFQPVS